MTASAAIGGIRRNDKTGAIGLFSSDRYPPYNRPPLSKKLWIDERLEDIWCRSDFASLGVTEHLTTSITHLDPNTHSVEDDKGGTWTYGKLLLATGGSPRRLSDQDPGVVYFRNLDDYLKVYQATKNDAHVVIVGAGFIGSELAAVLSMRGVRVTMVFPETHLLASRFPRDLTKYLEQVYQQHGVQLLAGHKVTDVERRGGQSVLTFGDGTSLTGDLVVAGIGLKPNTELADKAGIEIGDGILVNAQLQTSVGDIFAAGDVASFRLPHLSHRLRLEHEDNAMVQGRMAGENMAGAGKSYLHLPFFYSDLYTMGYEAVGTIDSQLEVYADWTSFGEEGVLYYLNNRQVVGVVNWNVWDSIPAARQLITEGLTVDHPKELKGRIGSP